MKTALISPATPASSSSPAIPDPSTPSTPPKAPLAPPAPAGRPTALTKELLALLCSIIRETGASDSAAAARASLHPSTVSRWKRDNLDFAILLRGAREDFRQAQLEILHREAHAGRASSWRAAAWLLERIFPEDYAPRARERARFQEQFEAIAAREVEVQVEESALPDRGEPLQNVQNTPALPASERPRDEQANLARPSSAATPGAEEPPAGPLAELQRLGSALQNVQNTPLGSSEDRRAAGGRS